MSREELEVGMELRGLLLFRNELKHDTAAAILDLKGAQVSSKYLMCYGSQGAVKLLFHMIASMFSFVCF